MTLVTTAPPGLTFICRACGENVLLPPPSAKSARCAHCGEVAIQDDGILRLGDSADPDDYPEDLHALLFSIEPRHFWFDERNTLILRTMRDTIGPLSGRTVVDIGCGNGYVTAALERAGMLACGLDMNMACLHFARRRMQGPLVCETAARVPFRDQFDVAMLCDVIEHTPDDVAVLEEAGRSLVSSGAVVVTVPAYPGLWTNLDDAVGHKRRYTRTSLRRAMQDAGFSVVTVRHFNSLLVPIQALQRWLMRQPDPTNEAERLILVRSGLRVPPEPLNSVLRLAMAADRGLGRLAWGFGTSLIGVGTLPMPHR